MINPVNYHCVNMEWRPPVPPQTARVATRDNGENVLQLLPSIVLKQEPGTNSALARRARSHLMCFFCEARFDDNRLLRVHQDNCDQRAVEMEVILLDRPNTASRSSRAEKRTFLDSLDLITTGKAEVMSQSRLSTVTLLHDDVIVVDDSDEDSDPDESTASPLSPVELMKSPRKFNSGRGKKRKRRTSPNGIRKGTSNRLLKIDVCSPLGVRLKEHMVSYNISRTHFDTCTMNIVGDFDDIERFCKGRTHDVDHQRSAVLSTWRAMHNRRITATSFAVTFHQTPRLEKHCHRFKFSRRQKVEFCRTFDTGLNARARELQKALEPSFVKLVRLSLESFERINCAGEDGGLGCSRSVCEGCRFMVEPCGHSNDVDSSDGVSTDGSGCDTSFPSADRASNLRISFRRAVCKDRTICRDSAEWYIVGKQRDASRTDVSSQGADDSSSEIGEQSDDDDDDDDDANGTSIDTELFAEPPESDEESPLPQTDSSESECSSESGLSRSVGDRVMDLWSSSDCLPPLCFLCGICNVRVKCSKDSRSAILSHYASHGITNISLITETLPNGNIELKLVELPDDDPPPPILEREDIAEPSANKGVDVLSDVVESDGRSGEKLQSTPLDESGGSPSCASPMFMNRKRVSWNDHQQLSAYPDEISMPKKFKQSVSPGSTVPFEPSRSQQQEPSLPQLPYHGVHCSPTGLNWLAAPNHDASYQTPTTDAVPQQIYFNNCNNNVYELNKSLRFAQSQFTVSQQPNPTPYYSTDEFFPDWKFPFYGNNGPGSYHMPNANVHWNQLANRGFAGYQQTLQQTLGAPPMNTYNNNNSNPSWYQVASQTLQGNNFSEIICLD